ncbi:MAG: hypothetical protein KME17_25030 [Cyanosarcina radialis HA8281-LM2]|jgi:hypothetical protein|nr:hypothetical protein [Cyanosarcina radialis HA8281-LM2]
MKTKLCLIFLSSITAIQMATLLAQAAPDVTTITLDSPQGNTAERDRVSPNPKSPMPLLPNSARNLLDRPRPNGNGSVGGQPGVSSVDPKLKQPQNDNARPGSSPDRY